MRNKVWFGVVVWQGRVRPNSHRGHLAQNWAWTETPDPQLWIPHGHCELWVNSHWVGYHGNRSEGLENPELSRLVFFSQDRSDYSFALFTCCQKFCHSTSCLPSSSNVFFSFFSKWLSWNISRDVYLEWSARLNLVILWCVFSSDMSSWMASNETYHGMASNESDQLKGQQWNWPVEWPAMKLTSWMASNKIDQLNGQ